MQKSFEIKSSLDSYQVQIGNNLIADLLPKINQNHILVCDESLVKTYNLDKFFKKIVLITANENSKDLSNISSVISQLKKFGLKRRDLLIGIGGGVIQDITCFVSSIYMRGVDWIYFPTTFLGMCDSCIGGKSSINVNGIKNLVGNFYPPKQILIDLSFAQSLPMEHMDSGFCEAVKICYAHQDEKIFDKFCEVVGENYKKNLFEIVNLTLTTKKWFIEIDEFDANERQLLNFGHTFGHAIEGSSSYGVPHGIAVGFGMLWAICFSSLINDDIARLDRVLKLKKIISDIVNPYKDFCGIVKNLNPDDLFTKFVSDKKHKSGKYVCILIDDNGFLYKAALDQDQKFLEKFKNSFAKLTSQI